MMEKTLDLVESEGSKDVKNRLDQATVQFIVKISKRIESVQIMRIKVINHDFHSTIK